ncbi:hypothetical protein Q9295_09400 [Xinfangfangia sp. CPCC 101601]|uniref:Nucleotide-diphospho-sugar transferase domain-containing protein n=1 Tax=Pseudogemmobacter lacusdianii TaxID=3069608 RepID=A0ABU0VXV5_9RHOB|nr:hypothetical protein [Xinfangfangia sp. CPCC 101601]MDQ2066590.1 hypothetical protein [Xinfangfangia sp. CPCC 101601]
MPKPRLTFVYIVEPPDYQTMACMLLASIRENFGPEVATIGYCPEHRMAELHPGVLRAHEMLGAEIRPMRTLGMWDAPYPHGNKIIAAMQPRESEFSAFVDSDVLFLQPNSAEALVKQDHVSCSVAASMNWGEQSVWERIYARFDMKVPQERVRLMRRTRQEVVPYFSAGLVVFPEATGQAQRFPDVWYDTARQLDRDVDLPHRRPYLDQMTLPLAIQRAGLAWNILPEAQHYILGGLMRGKALPEDQVIHTVHYRNPTVLREAGLMNKGRAMMRKHYGVNFVGRLAPEASDPEEGQG